MRIRTRKNLKKKNLAIVFLFLLPMIGFMGYASIILYILYDINSFTYRIPPPETDNFYPLSQINDARLEEMARILDYRNTKFNSPIGYPVDVTFKNRSYNYDSISFWHHTDNGALHNAYALAAACFKYKIAKEEEHTEDLENATKDVKFYVKAMSNLIAAPNGGLGINPETGNWYPGILSRFACTWRDAIKYHPFMLEDHPRHHNGTGVYSNWRVRLKTSRDEVSGYYLGWACVLKFITGDDDDSKWCVERVKLMVEQVLHHWQRESNWLVLDYDGTPTGSDINSQTWQLVGLRIGATALPEKYLSLYQYAATKILSMNGASMGGSTNAGFEYYAYMLAGNSMFSLILLEDDPFLQYHYIKNYEETMYKVVRYHRNAYFNTLHLVFMSLLDKNKRTKLENPDYGDDNILWDVKDQLWRFHMSNWCPIRNYNLTDRPHSTRSTSLNPEMRKKLLDPTKQKWRDFFENNLFGHLFSWIGEEFQIDDDIYLIPRTISESYSQHMIWQSTPFYKEGGDLGGNGLTEPPGTSYTLVYWLARCYDLF